jgi:alanine racemase
MSRNGLEMATEQGQKDAVAITKVPILEVVAIMTHFAERYWSRNNPFRCCKS